MIKAIIFDLGGALLTIMLMVWCCWRKKELHTVLFQDERQYFSDLNKLLNNEES